MQKYFLMILRRLVPQPITYLGIKTIMCPSYIVYSIGTEGLVMEKGWEDKNKFIYIYILLSIN